MQNNLKSFLYYFFVRFVVSVLCLSAYNFSSLFPYIYFCVGLFVFLCDLFCTHGRVQNKHKLWKRAWIRRTASVRLCIPQCSNIYFSSFYFLCARSSFFFSCIPLLNSTFSHFQNLSFSRTRILTVRFFQLLSHKMHFGFALLRYLFILLCRCRQSFFVVRMYAFVAYVSW